MFKIHNVRLGFATNSSSSHSIVFCRDQYRDKCYGQDYGWDQFTLNSDKAKLEYIGQIIKLNLHENPQVAAKKASKLVGVYVDPNGYIDHQSHITLPTKKTKSGKTVLDKKFLTEFIKLCLNPNIKILGGNDNEGEHPLYNHPGTIHTNISDSLPIIKYNDKYKYWTLFNRVNGSKVRISNTDEDIFKSDTPELVDFKITDYCSSDCVFCYQNSSKEGKHAELTNIRSIVKPLSKLGVFEIALGGGEPTSHPQFIEILDLIKKNNIIANFSTRNVNWLVKNWNNIEDKVKAVGLSCNNELLLVKDLKKLDRLPIVIQIPVGSCSEQSLYNIMKVANNHYKTVLLLGWKRVGRGEVGPTYDVNIERVLKKFIKSGRWTGPNLSVDTLLASQIKPWLQKHKVRPYYYEIKEGAFSMYIDAVNSKIGPSSFCPNEELIELPRKNIKSVILENFSKW